MDRNTFTGLFLMLIIIVGSVYWMRPSEEEIKREQLLQDSIKYAQTAAPDSVANAVNLLDTASSVDSLQDSISATGPFGNSKKGNENIITLENELIKVNITNKGGRIKSVELKGQLDYNGNPLIMFDGNDNTFGLQFSTAGENITTNDLYFVTQSKGFEVSKGDSTSATFRLNYADGKYIDYI